jgi:uncharacterized protein
MMPAAIRDLLACPTCHGPLTDVVPADAGSPTAGAAVGLVGLDCAACRVRFPVRDGIPVLLVDQAESR